jgi:hypothetical protein
MARKTIFVSDLTERTIDEKDAATVTIRYSDARRGQVVLDVNREKWTISPLRAASRLGAAESLRPNPGGSLPRRIPRSNLRYGQTPSPGLRSSGPSR